ncbi:hypothetical protein RAAC3_TM7C00001G0236 [Candidatus Saccharibacteria bacterium RAAC3_TM7_1]|nr:hypothetical protein RAAC3_TM7C00001G0236 [Candidatus Saccharibacteria bacterium RAAC3_TM7_1]
MTEVLSNGTDKPRIFVDDEGDVRSIDDYPDMPDDDRADVATKKLPYHEREHAQYERPATLEESVERIRREDIARHAIRPLTAFEELVGGRAYDLADDLPRERPLDNVIRTIGTKVPEVREAVERFGLNELSTIQYEAMNNDTQKKHFVVAFQKFYNLILAHARRIVNVEGDLHLDHALMKYHSLDEPPEQVAEYGRYLEALLAAIDDTGIPARVGQDLQKFYTNDIKLRIILKNADYQKYQLTFKVAKDGQKTPMRDSHRLSA